MANLWITRCLFELSRRPYHPLTAGDLYIAVRQQGGLSGDDFDVNTNNEPRYKHRIRAALQRLKKDGQVIHDEANGTYVLAE